jgi:hypothetical protein
MPVCKWPGNWNCWAGDITFERCCATEDADGTAYPGGDPEGVCWGVFDGFDYNFESCMCQDPDNKDPQPGPCDDKCSTDTDGAVEDVVACDACRQDNPLNCDPPCENGKICKDGACQDDVGAPACDPPCELACDDAGENEATHLRCRKELCAEIPLESGLDHHGQDEWIGAAVSLCARSKLASSWRGAPDIVGGWQCRTDSVDCFSAGMRIGTLPEDARPTGTALYAVRVCPGGRCPSAEDMHGDVMMPIGLQLKANPDGALTLILPEGGYPTNTTVMAVGGLLSSPIAIGWARGETDTGFRGLT